MTLSSILLTGLLVIVSADTLVSYVSDVKNLITKFTVNLISNKMLLCKNCPNTDSSGQYFLAFGRNTEIHSLSLRIQSIYGKLRIKNTPYLHTFHAVKVITHFVNFQDCSITLSFEKVSTYCKTSDFHHYYHNS